MRLSQYDLVKTQGFDFGPGLISSRHISTSQGVRDVGVTLALFDHIEFHQGSYHPAFTLNDQHVNWHCAASPMTTL